MIYNKKSESLHYVGLCAGIMQYKEVEETIYVSISERNA